MEKNNHVFNNGEIVFVNSTHNVAEKCEIISSKETSFPESGSRQYYLRSLEYNSCFLAFEENIFLSKNKALKDSSEKYAGLVRTYCKEIKDIDDLIRFPLKHCFGGEEYTEYEAREAYCIRAKELAGIENLS